MDLVGIASDGDNSNLWFKNGLYDKRSDCKNSYPSACTPWPCLELFYGNPFLYHHRPGVGHHTIRHVSTRVVESQYVSGWMPDVDSGTKSDHMRIARMAWSVASHGPAMGSGTAASTIAVGSGFTMPASGSGPTRTTTSSVPNTCTSAIWPAAFHVRMTMLASPMDSENEVLSVAVLWGRSCMATPMVAGRSDVTLVGIAALVWGHGKYPPSFIPIRREEKPFAGTSAAGSPARPAWTWPNREEDGTYEVIL